MRIPPSTRAILIVDSDDDEDAETAERFTEIASRAEGVVGPVLAQQTMTDTEGIHGEGAVEPAVKSEGEAHAVIPTCILCNQQGMRCVDCDCIYLLEPTDENCVQAARGEDIGCEEHLLCG